MAKKPPPALVPVLARMPDVLRDKLKDDAEANGRSMNAEITHRLATYEDMARRIAVAEAIEARLLGPKEAPLDETDHFNAGSASLHILPEISPEEAVQAIAEMFGE